MRQVKLFKGVEVEIRELEREINDWIKDNNINVVSISGTISPQSVPVPGQQRMSGSDLLMIVEYER